MFIYRIFSVLEGTSITIQAWLSALLGVIVVRTFLENFAGLRVGAAITTNAHSLIHFSIYWLVMSVLLTLVIHYFTQKRIETVAKVTLFGTLLIFIAPILGFIFSKGAGQSMTYLDASSFQEVLQNFFTVYFINTDPGVTLGMRLEIVLVAIVVFLYARYSGLSIFKSLATSLAAYFSIFISGILPFLLSVTGTYSWMLLMQHSLIGTNYLHPMLEINSGIYLYETFFDIILSQALYLILVVSGLILFLRLDYRKTTAVLKNCRPERVAHYLAMVVLGILIAVYQGTDSFLISSWINISTTIILFLVFYFAWMYAVGVNDIFDKKYDILTNPRRPLVLGELSEDDMKSGNLIFLVMSLTGAYLVGPEVFFLVAVYIAISHIYSSPPLQLKRFATLNPFLVSLASLTAVMAGFFTYSRTVEATSFEPLWIITIVVVYTLFANIKDIKDFKSDKIAGIYTIPVIFGLSKGKKIIWVLVTTGLFLLAFVLGGGIYFLTAVIGSILSGLAIFRQPYSDKLLFSIYLMYVVTLGLVFLF